MKPPILAAFEDQVRRSVEQAQAVKVEDRLSYAKWWLRAFWSAAALLVLVKPLAILFLAPLLLDLLLERWPFQPIQRNVYVPADKPMKASTFDSSDPDPIDDEDSL